MNEVYGDVLILDKQIEEFEMSRKRKLKKPRRKSYFKQFCNPIRTSLEESGYKFVINERRKEEFIALSERDALPEIHCAMDIVVDTPSDNDCFRVYGLVVQIYIPMPDCFKNYVSVTGENGYRCLHTVILGQEGKFVGLRIGTKEMFESS